MRKHLGLLWAVTGLFYTVQLIVALFRGDSDTTFRAQVSMLLCLILMHLEFHIVDKECKS